MMETITITQLRTNFDNILKEVQLNNKSFTITRYGKPLAVLMSIEAYNKLKNEQYSK